MTRVASGLAAAGTLLFSNSAQGQEALNGDSKLSAETSPPSSIWTRPTLGGDWAGLRPLLDEHGVSFQVEWTQFGSGMTSGEGPKNWQYGGKGDFYLKINGAKAGLWEGLFIDVRGEQNYGRNVNGQGDTMLPNNASLAFPGAREGDLGVEITQKFSDAVALKFGKLNMVDAAKATPIKGGGGIDTFMNTALAVPPSGLIPPEIFGAFFSVNTKTVNYAVAVYDPLSAAQRTDLEDPFRDGVSFRASATLKVKPFGLPGFYGVKAMYSTMHAFDLRSIPDLILPPEDNAVLPTRSNPFFVGVSVQQFLHQDANDPKQGWGFFGEFGRSDGNPTRQEWAAYVGIGGTGLIPGRSGDRYGIGGFQNSLSDYLVDGLSPLIHLRDEQGVEAFYNAAITPWLHVSADLQWVRPYLEDSSNAVFATVRTNIKF